LRKKKKEKKRLDEENKKIFITKTKVCQFFKNGRCNYGYRCHYRHVDMHCKKPEIKYQLTHMNEIDCLEPYLTCVLCQEIVPWEDVTTTSDIRPPRKTHCDTCKELEWRKKELEKSKTAQCAICLDDAFRNDTKCCLLSHCVHVFHTDCIKQWKQIKNNQIDCPLCRTKSTYIIPSRRYIFDPQRKQEHFDQLLKEWSTQPCKHWEKSHECPFGYRCRFGHYDKNGQLISKTEKHKHPMPLEIRRKLMERRRTQQSLGDIVMMDYDDYVSFHLEMSLLLVSLLGDGILDVD